MEPNSFGRKLGIGVRVAGNIARARAAEAGRRAEAPRPQAEIQQRQRAQEDLKQRTQNLGKGLGRGTKSFGRSVFGPFMHASGVLWLEITGCFFALFAAFFGQNAFKLRAQYAAGAQHQKFLLFAVLTLLFVYFSASSFVRARRKGRKKLAGR